MSKPERLYTICGDWHVTTGSARRHGAKAAKHAGMVKRRGKSFASRPQSSASDRFIDAMVSGDLGKEMRSSARPQEPPPRDREEEQEPQDSMASDVYSILSMAFGLMEDEREQLRDAMSSTEMAHVRRGQLVASFLLSRVCRSRQDLQLQRSWSKWLVEVVAFGGAHFSTMAKAREKHEWFLGSGAKCRSAFARIRRGKHYLAFTMVNSVCAGRRLVQLCNTFLRWRLRVRDMAVLDCLVQSNAARARQLMQRVLRQAKFAAKRVLTKIRRRVFWAWRSFTQRRRLAARSFRRTFRHATTIRLKRCFGHWRCVHQEDTTAEAALVFIARSGARLRLRQSFKSWTALSSRILRRQLRTWKRTVEQRALNATAVQQKWIQTLRKERQGKHFRAWVHNARNRQQGCRMLFSSLGRLADRRSWRAFLQWKKLDGLEVQKEAFRTRHYARARRAETVKAFYAWRRISALRRSRHRLCDAHRRGRELVCLSRTLHMWTMYVSRRRRCRFLLQGVSGVLHRAERDRTLAEKRTAFGRLRRRLLMDQMVSSLSKAAGRGSLLSGFSRWRRLCLRQLQASSVCLRKSLHQLEGTTSRWRMHCEGISLRADRLILEKVLLSWKMHLLLLRCGRSLLSRWCLRRKQALVCVVWRCWSNLVSDTCQREANLRQATARWTSCRVLRFWAQRALRQHKLRGVALSWRLKAAKAAFNALSTHRREVKGAQLEVDLEVAAVVRALRTPRGQRSGLLVRVLNGSGILVSFTKWRQFADARRVMKRRTRTLVQRCFRRNLAAAFARFRQQVRRARTVSAGKLRAKVVLQRWSQKHVYWAFISLRRHSYLASKHEASNRLLKLAVQRWLGRKVRAAFSRLRDRYFDVRKLLEKEMDHRRLKAVLRKWIHRKVLDAFKRLQLLRSASRCLNTLHLGVERRALLPAFKLWQRLPNDLARRKLEMSTSAAVHEAEEIRSQLDKSRSTLSVLNRSRLLASTRLIKMRSLLMLSRVMSSWRRRLNLLRGCGKVLRRLGWSRKAKAFGLWRSEARQRRTLDALVLQVRRRWQRRGLKLCLKAWRQYGKNVQAMGTMASRLQHHTRTLKAFKFWNARIRHQQIVHEGKLRLLSIYWRRFDRQFHRRRLARKVTLIWTERLTATAWKRLALAVQLWKAQGGALKGLLFDRGIASRSRRFFTLWKAESRGFYAQRWAAVSGRCEKLSRQLANCQRRMFSLKKQKQARTCFHDWKTRAMRTRRRRALIFRICARRKDALRRLSLALWLRHAKFEDLCCRLEARLGRSKLHRLAKQSLSKWKAASHARAVGHMMLQKARRRLHLLRCAHVFAGWRHFTRLQLRAVGFLRAALRRMWVSDTREGFRRWRSFARLSQRLDRQDREEELVLFRAIKRSPRAAKVMMHLRTAPETHFFCRWKEFTAQIRQRRRILRRAVVLLLRASLGFRAHVQGSQTACGRSPTSLDEALVQLGWSAWRRYDQEAVEVATVCNLLLLRCTSCGKRRALLRAWQSWRQLTQSKHDFELVKRSVVLSCTAHARRSCRVIFYAWRLLRRRRSSAALALRLSRKRRSDLRASRALVKWLRGTYQSAKGAFLLQNQSVLEKAYRYRILSIILAGVIAPAIKAKYFAKLLFYRWRLVARSDAVDLASARILSDTVIQAAATALGQVGSFADLCEASQAALRRLVPSSAGCFVLIDYGRREFWTKGRKAGLDYDVRGPVGKGLCGFAAEHQRTVSTLLEKDGRYEPRYDDQFLGHGQNVRPMRMSVRGSALDFNKSGSAPETSAAILHVRSCEGILVGLLTCCRQRHQLTSTDIVRLAMLSAHLSAGYEKVRSTVVSFRSRRDFTTVESQLRLALDDRAHLKDSMEGLDRKAEKMEGQVSSLRTETTALQGRLADMTGHAKELEQLLANRRDYADC